MAIWIPGIFEKSTKDATAQPSNVEQGKIFYNADGRQIGTAEMAKARAVVLEMNDPSSAAYLSDSEIYIIHESNGFYYADRYGTYTITNPHCVISDQSHHVVIGDCVIVTGIEYQGVLCRIAYPFWKKSHVCIYGNNYFPMDFYVVCTKYSSIGGWKLACFLDESFDGDRNITLHYSVV